MSEFEKQEQTTPGYAAQGHVASNIAFRQAMVDVRARCRLLTERFDKGQLAEAERIVLRAATVWLAGREACHRLVESIKADSPYAYAARKHLQSAYELLLTIIARAYRALDDQEIRNALDKARMELVQTMAADACCTTSTSTPEGQRAPSAERTSRPTGEVA
jgi:hypothetical protein